MCCTCAGSNPSLLSPLNVFWVISHQQTRTQSSWITSHLLPKHSLEKTHPSYKCRLSVQCLAEHFSHGWSHIAVEWRCIIKVICLKHKSANESHVKSLPLHSHNQQYMLTLGNDTHYFPADNLTHCRIKTEGAFTWLMSTFPNICQLYVASATLPLPGMDGIVAWLLEIRQY